MLINPVNNMTAFHAKFYPYPRTLTNKNILNLFEERTSRHPDLILKHDSISYFNNDYFILYKENKPNILAHGFFSFTRNHPKDAEKFVARLTEILDILCKKPVPQMHEDK